MKKLKKLTGVLSVILLSVAFAALVTYVTAPEDERAELAGIIASSENADRVRQIDWESLPPEVVAWVEVPGTSIDEPVVQASPDEPNAYLYRDALGQGAYGTPYIDSECSLDSSFVMVYGHHMSDGSAFADFANFIDEAYAQEHDEIIIYQRESLRIDQGVAPAERIAESDLILCDPGEAEQLFAFTTCSYQTWNSRTTVYAIEHSRLSQQR